MPSPLVAALARERREALLAWATRRLGDRAAAEDVLQVVLLRALERGPDTTDPDHLRAWLYRTLRHAVVDAHRRQSAAARAFARYRHETPDRTEPDGAAVPCTCVRPLLPTLPPPHAELLEAELNGEPSELLAARLGLTPGALRVRRHRARRRLRDRLVATCGACAENGCTDCSCRPQPAVAQ